jgi:hypothetical protein
MEDLSAPLPVSSGELWIDKWSYLHTKPAGSRKLVTAENA